MDGSEDDLVFDYELLNEKNANNENLKKNKYEEVEFDNVWE
ncbi:672_t:CDS:2 [Cetraspora pellucida]|uniref:672_t:CDS:1 n=1 Tax=Cetraspora pellucida TaxID=1433469 RepID=A0A9N9EV75_9GLOM|nr:672_t:CDS:2 [Cetraspora pellucida]